MIYQLVNKRTEILAIATTHIAHFLQLVLLCFYTANLYATFQ